MKNYAGEYIYHLPWYDKENITFIDMARVIELSYRFLERQLEVVERNLFIDTAIEALPIFQRDLGLQISSEVPLEQRRKIIRGYLHYLHEQTTEEVVRELCKSFENVTSDIDIEKALAIDTYNVNVNYTFDHKVDYKSLDTLLRKILPAHLSYIMNIIAKTHHNIYIGMTAISGKKRTHYPLVVKDRVFNHEIFYGMSVIRQKRKRVFKKHDELY